MPLPIEFAHETPPPAVEDVDGAAAAAVDGGYPIGRHVARVPRSQRIKNRTEAQAKLRKSPVDMVGGLYSDSELVPKDGKRANTEAADDAAVVASEEATHPNSGTLEDW